MKRLSGQNMKVTALLRQQFPSLCLLCCFCMLCGKRQLLDTLSLLLYLENNENLQIMSGNGMPHICTGADYYHSRGEGLLTSRIVNNKGRWQDPFPDEDRHTMPSHSQYPLSFLFACLWLDKLTLNLAVSKKNCLKRSNGGHLICQLQPDAKVAIMILLRDPDVEIEQKAWKHCDETLTGISQQWITYHTAGASPPLVQTLCGTATISTEPAVCRASYRLTISKAQNMFSLRGHQQGSSHGGVQENPPWGAALRGTS